jgi:hypothetical protein
MCYNFLCGLVDIQNLNAKDAKKGAKSANKIIGNENEITKSNHQHIKYKRVFSRTNRYNIISLLL